MRPDSATPLLVSLLVGGDFAFPNLQHFSGISRNGATERKLTLFHSYWFKYIVVTPNLTAVALVIQFWVDRDKVNPGVFIAVFLVAITCINYFGSCFFGEFEF